MKRFCISYLDRNSSNANEPVWLYLRAYSEEQLRDMFIEYDIINIWESEV